MLPDFLARPVVISVHDVMPETLDRVGEQLDMLRERGLGPATLLVVPGGNWTPPALERLRAWAGEGHILAGHGWSHRAGRIRGPKHRLHALLISGGCAEHLALDGDAIVSLMTRCRTWFGDNALPAPNLYVPPAWAPGPVDAGGLAATGFAWLETLRGFYDIGRRRWHLARLVGFEAHNPFQHAFLKLSNGFNRHLPGKRPLRIALHPHDHHGRMRADLAGQLDRLTA